MKKFSILLALAALALAGCNGGNQENSGNPPTAQNGGSGNSPPAKDFTITVIAKSTTNPVFQYALAGAKAAAADLGPKNHTHIQIDWETPANEDGQVQAQNIDQAVDRHVDAILISCSDAAKVTGSINKAVDAGVPVMTFDSDAPDSKRFAFYGVDDEAAGAEVMDELAKQVKGLTNVAILSGNPNAPNLKKRVDGATTEAAKYPNIKLLAQPFYLEHETPDDASQVVTNAMSAHPEIQAWAMIGGWPLFAKSLLTELPSRHVKVVSVDALPAELAYVDAGIAPVLLAQPCYKWGYASVGIIVDHVLNKKEVPVINPMPLVPVTKANLGDWARTLKSWGADVDPKYLAMK
ncbi:MAG TPA: substrate-binding domain-containing protein [Fimbriimonadaceae bacterium]|nr:substrate-binding domain-containing protein [Fimbriimonadaceae bacterium]